jgi:hypothetical protein
VKYCSTLPLPSACGFYSASRISPPIRLSDSPDEGFGFGKDQSARPVS